MKIVFNFLTIVLLISCTGKSTKNNDKSLEKINYSTRSVSDYDKEKSTDNDLIDTLSTMITEYGGIKFYTEDKLRGEGVVSLLIDRDLEILNVDKTVFGSIRLNKNEEEPFDIKLPKSVIAREIIPNVEYRIFCFDAEQPITDKDFLIIYINKEKRLINKNECKYKFNSWQEYVKTAFIHLTPKVENSSKKEQLYYYETLEIKGDSMKIKSVSKTSCDYVEEYRDVTKWIKWKDNSYKFVTFDFCY